MAHELETFADGTAAFFTARETAWHQLGTVTSDAVTAEDAMRIAHLDWTVEKHPVHTTVMNDDGVTTVQVDGQFATVRQHPISGEYQALGVVGANYQIVQNIEHAGFLNTLVDESGARFETGGSLQDGRKIFLTMKVPQTLQVGGVDPVDLYLVAENSHDGSSSFRVAVTPVRVVCANTLRFGLQAARHTFSIRHTSGATGRIEEARRALGLTFRYVEEFEAQAQRLIEQDMTNRQFLELVDRIWPADENRTERKDKNRDERRAQMLALFRDAPTQDKVRGTAWAGLNAVTEWAEWASPVRGDANARAARNLTSGNIAHIRDRAFAELTS